jgi:hypothetical protein
MPGIWQILIVENEFQAGGRSVISAPNQKLRDGHELKSLPPNANQRQPSGSLVLSRA